MIDTSDILELEVNNVPESSMKFKKILLVAKKEQVLQLMLYIFMFVAFVTCAAVTIGPVYMSPEAVRAQFAADPNGLHGWLFILVPSISIPLIVGLIYLLYRAWRPSKD